MIKTELRAGPSIVVDGWEIVPIESIMCVVTSIGGRLTAMASREPVAILARSGGTCRALDLDGREIPIVPPRDE